MISIAICDDNAENLIELQDLANEMNFDKDVTCFDSSVTLANYLNTKNKPFDIIITDIKMPDIDGINLAKSIKRNYPNTHFIFVTSYSEYIQDVFTVNPVYYILKPIDKNKFAEAINLAKDRIIASKGNTINFVSKKKALRIQIDDIQFVESINRTAVFHLSDSTEDINIKLDNIEKDLPSNFIRCHKSYLVNMNVIHEILNNKITLFSGAVIPVAKSRFHDVKKRILYYWGDIL